MKKRFLIALLIVLSLFLIVSCSNENGVNGNNGSQSGTLFDPDNVTLLSAYSQAQELGFAGTLEEFIELISGKDGEDGKDGADGITPTIEVSEDGYWIINGTKTEYKAIGTDGNNGTDGDDGKDGATIDKIEFDENGKLVVTLTDGTVLDPIDLPEKEEHSHVFETWYIQKEIVLDGEYCENHVFCAVCTECGELGWRIGSYDDHIFDIKTVAPTCADQGYDIKTCPVCGKEEKINFTNPDPSAHEWANEYSYDELHHWVDCTRCNEKNEYAKHGDTNSDRYCDVCDQDINGSGEIVSYPWDNQTLIFQLTENDNSKELSSGCHRYLAGDSTTDTAEIDISIDRRNSRAERSTKTEVTYLYWPNTKEYGWGECIERIEEIINSATIRNAPDVYVNFMYDIVGASVKGYFANLKGTSRGLGELKGINYFEFNDPDYYEETANLGYMNEWMNSLTLSKHKTYVLGSDYFTDIIRASYVIPVSIKLLESVGYEDYITGDRDGDGKFTIDDFYDQVYNREWTYDLLMRYSEAIARDDGMGETSKWLGDTQIGFAMAHGGVAGTGLLYTTSVTIIEREWDVSINDYKYYYPDTNEGLAGWIASTTELFNANGVILVPSSSSDPLYKIDWWGSTHLQAIRKRFSENAVLFGDIVMVGALEYQEYQDMHENGGFGVVPVPLYHDNEDKFDRYLTQIHNVGRPGAIAVNTTKFVECTAFLNYQSTHSTDILNQYYNYELMYNTTGDTTGTVEMLQYIRNNVRNSFDKAMEDAMGAIKGGEAMNRKISGLVSAESYQCADIRGTYNTHLAAKRGDLTDLLTWFQDAQD